MQLCRRVAFGQVGGVRVSDTGRRRDLQRRRLSSGVHDGFAVQVAEGTTAVACLVNAKRFVEAYGSRKTDDYNLGNTEAPTVLSNITFSANQMTTAQMVIDRRCHGIPFVIDDQRALDAVVRYHRCNVEVTHVERYMVPFWLGSTSAGGQFKAEVLQRNPTTLEDYLVWNQTAPYDFAYPFGDHFAFNQIAASYVMPNSALEKCLAGTHIPSMLISRYELREEIEAMKVAPKLLPFIMSTSTASDVLASRLTKDKVETFAQRELKKYHGGMFHARVMFLSLIIEALRIRPVFLPMYKLVIRTRHSRRTLPVYVCGATGNCDGPVVTEDRMRKWSIGGTVGTATFALGLMASPAPELCAVIGVAAAWVATKVYYLALLGEAAKRVALDEVEARTKEAMNARQDEAGYKWTVEDEEKHEYQWREELRAKARKRADFEQRVRDETEREEAMRQGKAYFARKRKSAPGTIERDPLGYYALLGLAGKETTATPREVAQAFRKEAHKHHPDIAPEGQQEAANLKMQNIVEAYTVLRDATLRREYDNGLLTSAPGAAAKSNSSGRDNPTSNANAGSGSGRAEAAREAKGQQQHQEEAPAGDKATA